MSKSDVSPISPNFDRAMRMFPLPNLVMFPNVLQPLHIFEPRYREMVDEAIDHDGLITMALLKPGWETQYDGRPAVHREACLGRIVTHVRLKDGRYNLLLRGLCRVTIVRELEPRKLFREVMVKPVEEVFSTSKATSRDTLHRSLLDEFRRTLPDSQEVRQQLEAAVGGPESLGTLTDLVSYTLQLSLSAKRRLLAEPNIARRASLLLQTLRKAREPDEDGDDDQRFPPDFSAN